MLGIVQHIPFKRGEQFLRGVGHVCFGIDVKEANNFLWHLSSLVLSERFICTLNFITDLKLRFSHPNEITNDAVHLALGG